MYNCLMEKKKGQTIMMNEELYEALEQELEKNHVEEDVEDVLLDLAENIAERGIVDKEVIFKQSYGRTEVHGCGVCAEEDGDTSVLIKWVRVGKKEFEIDDYFL
ncbi:U-box domain-containing protein 56 [Hungatella sp.]|uniref:U-box domain-containing protein 56 n=2 Tax=Hungatella sp. TaxID=2613924 RepID=UPI002A80F59B|nr:U-box domain-containing protein 56 [Hungatella sp.]